MKNIHTAEGDGNTFSMLKQQQVIEIGSPQFTILLDEISSDAERRRREGKNERPYYAMELIRKARLGALQLPIEKGGRLANIEEIFSVVVQLAQADPDVAHILRSHFGHVEQIVRGAVEAEKADVFLQQVANGAIIGNAFTERSSQKAGSAQFETTLLPDGEDYRLNGIKYFSTGTLYADLVYVIASTAEGIPITAIIPTNREGVRIVDDWDGFGQKLTGSGTTIFENVWVGKYEVIEHLPSQTPFNSFPQLYLHAVMVGILKNVVEDAADLVRNRKRTFSFAAAETPRQDPQLLQIIGEISSIAFAAESILLKVAATLEHAASTAVGGDINFASSHQASLEASQAKVIIDSLALRAATLLFEVGGASATKQSAHLDRHWRNIRTLASHNPTVYKARTIGDYVVNDVSLPLQEIYF